MSGMPSSDDGKENSPSDYDSLEEYIFNTTREDEDEEKKQIRFREWQEMQLKAIMQTLGTNRVEVVARSYLMGLERVREKHYEDVDSLADLLVDFLQVIGNDARNRDVINEIHGKVGEYEIPEPTVENANLTDPKHCRIRRSALSEVQNDYIDKGFFGAWIHRYIASLGFLDSELLNDFVEDNLSSVGAYVTDSVDESRFEVERLVQDYISLSIPFWIENGLPEETYDRLNNIVSMMETDRQQPCDKMMNRVDDLVQVDGDEDDAE